MELKMIDGTYVSLLRAVGLEVTPDYFVRMYTGKDKDGKPTYIPVTKGGRQMVLPVSEQLRHQDISNRLVFHPLAENAATKDTEILTFYRHILINRINRVVGVLGQELLRIAGSKGMHNQLSPRQQEFLMLVPEADERSRDTFETLSEKASKANQLHHTFVSLYLKKSGVHKGSSYQRVASINFPFYDELVKWEEDDKLRKAAKAKKAKPGEHEIFDVPVRVKDRETFKGLMNYLIPNVTDSHFYDVGSNSQVAPGTHAMMTSVTPLLAHLNEVSELFDGLIPDAKEMIFDMEWVESINNLDALWPQIRNIPQQSHAVSEEPAAPAKPNPLPWEENRPAPSAAPAAAPVAPPPAPAPTMMPPPAANPAYPPPTQPMAYPTHQPAAQPQHHQPAAPARSGVALRDLMRPGMGGGMPYPGQVMQPSYPAPGYPMPGGYPPAATAYPGMAPYQPPFNSLPPNRNY